MVGHPEQRALGGFPSPTAPGDEGTDRQPPTPTPALAWRHLCGAPLTAAPEAALHTPISPDHPACPKYPPGRKGIPGSPPTGHRVWAGMRRPLSLAAASGAILWLRCVVVMWHVESSWSSDQTHVALHWQQILHHWTTREVPDLGYSGCGEIRVVCGHVSSVVGFGP